MKPKELPFNPYTKKFLSQVLGMSSATLTRFLNTHKTKILEEFPDYKPEDKRIHPDLFKKICLKNGVSYDRVAELIRESDCKYRDWNIERIHRIFGLI